MDGFPLESAANHAWYMAVNGRARWCAPVHPGWVLVPRERSVEGGTVKRQVSAPCSIARGRTNVRSQAVGLATDRGEAVGIETVH